MLSWFKHRLEDLSKPSEEYRTVRSDLKANPLARWQGWFRLSIALHLAYNRLVNQDRVVHTQKIQVRIGLELWEQRLCRRTGMMQEFILKSQKSCEQLHLPASVQCEFSIWHTKAKMWLGTESSWFPPLRPLPHTGSTLQTDLWTLCYMLWHLFTLSFFFFAQRDIFIVYL